MIGVGTARGSLNPRLPEVEILFRISPKSRIDIGRGTAHLSGYVVEGDLAFRCHGRWLGKLTDSSAPPEDADWFHLAQIWNFVYELGQALVLLEQGKTSEVKVEVEGTPVRLGIRWVVDRYALDEFLEAPPGPGHPAQLTRFREELVGVSVSRKALRDAVVDAIERLVSQIEEINPELSGGSEVISLLVSLKQLLENAKP